MASSNTTRDEDSYVEQCVNNFAIIASMQGRIAYMIMSVHAIKPSILTNLLKFNPHNILWYNMLYGMAVYIYSRPSMKSLLSGHRAMFSILGSCMFNFTAMRVFAYLAQYVDRRPNLMPVLGFMIGRTMLLRFLAYLYHVDTRGGHLRRDSYYDFLY